MTGPRVAALPMYGVDRLAVERFWDALASALREGGVTRVPERLDWPDDLPRHWRDPNLLLSQTCGYPLVEGLDAAVRVVGTFRYDADGAEGTGYRSLVVVRDSDSARALTDLQGRAVAYNGRDSHSGTNALRALVAPLATGGRFFGRTVESGAHRRSIDFVRDGHADVAAIDCVSFALIARHEPEAVAGLRVLARTAPAPGLPLVTARTTSEDELERIRRGIERVLADPKLRDARTALLIAGFERLGRADYHPIATMRDAARAAGYPEFA